MQALVTVRASPHRVRPDPEAEGIATYRWLANPADLVALGAALEHASEVVAVGIGGDRAETAIEAALRAGADDAVHVAYDPVGDPLGEKWASVLARTVQRVGGDAVFVGESAPTMGSEVAAIAGRKLGWATTTNVTALGSEAVAGDHAADEDALLVQRRLEPGRQEVLSVDTPAVLGVDSGFANPPRGSLDDVIAGQKADPTRYDLEAVAPGESRFSMSVGSLTRRECTANERVGRGAPPSGSVEARIRNVMGGASESGDGGDGERIDAPPAEAAERVAEYLAERDLC
ncbi:hypothetical protein VB773_00595 [Haloarculaceae archaeon H-GB2-1]|nr:hypothetical protein [Haloarculaceae archaeon H-GB11]MEA5406222.1 hypothetical protein [Haloarculaceae archaeon H-GB2-1]